MRIAVIVLLVCLGAVLAQESKTAEKTRPPTLREPVDLDRMWSFHFQGKKGNGSPCANANECTSNHCVDGVCCDTSCNTACESCLSADTGGTDGTCANVSAGIDPDTDVVQGQAGEFQAEHTPPRLVVDVRHRRPGAQTGVGVKADLAQRRLEQPVHLLLHRHQIGHRIPVRTFSHVSLLARNQFTTKRGGLQGPPLSVLIAALAVPGVDDFGFDDVFLLGRAGSIRPGSTGIISARRGG